MRGNVFLRNCKSFWLLEEKSRSLVLKSYLFDDKRVLGKILSKVVVWLDLLVRKIFLMWSGEWFGGKEFIENVRVLVFIRYDEG